MDEELKKILAYITNEIHNLSVSQHRIAEALGRISRGEDIRWKQFFENNNERHQALISKFAEVIGEEHEIIKNLKEWNPRL